MWSIFLTKDWLFGFLIETYKSADTSHAVVTSNVVKYNRLLKIYNVLQSDMWRLTPWCSGFHMHIALAMLNNTSNFHHSIHLNYESTFFKVGKFLISLFILY